MEDTHGKQVATGSPRPHERMSGECLEFDLQKQVELLRQEEAYRHGRNSKTLAKYPDFRVVLVVVRAGVRIREHTTAGRISVQVVSGLVRMRVGGRLLDLPAGHLAVIDRDTPHEVEAVDDGAFLLIIAWPQ